MSSKTLSELVKSAREVMILVNTLTLTVLLTYLFSTGRDNILIILPLLAVFVGNASSLVVELYKDEIKETVKKLEVEAEEAQPEKRSNMTDTGNKEKKTATKSKKKTPKSK